ncbi:MAG: SDR family oxidoreductase [Pseudomonadota bacterium]|nr:SDR family oxidoreductase [Pseudomonadota bacterium]
MKHAVITGGAAGLGADVARALSETGYRIGIFDLGAERVAEAASQLENAVGIEADVTSPDQVAAAFDAFGEVPDLLVNNAGIVRFGAMEEQSVQDYIDVVNVNLLGSCFCARAIAPAMMDRGSGHIINFTSINGVHPAPGVGLYGPTKAAMANMTQAMAIEWGPRGIRVNAIAPGMIDAGMSKPIFENPKVRATRGGGVPLRCLGEAADIAEAVLFLDSDGAKYISGHELVVDGGVSISVMAHLPRE